MTSSTLKMGYGRVDNCGDGMSIIMTKTGTYGENNYKDERSQQNIRVKTKMPTHSANVNHRNHKVE